MEKKNDYNIQSFSGDTWNLSVETFHSLSLGWFYTLSGVCLWQILLSKRQSLSKGLGNKILCTDGTKIKLLGLNSKHFLEESRDSSPAQYHLYWSLLWLFSWKAERSKVHLMKTWSRGLRLGCRFTFQQNDDPKLCGCIWVAWPEPWLRPNLTSVHRWFPSWPDRALENLQRVSPNPGVQSLCRHTQEDWGL